MCVKKCVAAENLVTKRVIASFEMCALVPIKLDIIISNPENCILFIKWVSNSGCVRGGTKESIISASRLSIQLFKAAGKRDMTVHLDSESLWSSPSTLRLMLDYEN